MRIHVRRSLPRCIAKRTKNCAAGAVPTAQFDPPVNLNARIASRTYSYAKLCLTLILVALRAGPIDASAPITKIRINHVIAA